MARHRIDFRRGSVAGLLAGIALLGLAGCASDEFAPLPPSGFLDLPPAAFASGTADESVLPKELEPGFAEAKTARQKTAADKKAAAAEKERLRRQEAETARAKKEADRAAARAAREAKRAPKAAGPEIQKTAEAASDAEGQAAPPLPAPRGSDYVLQAGDQIDVQVFREPDLSGSFKLGAAGDIRHSLLGAVPLAGQTVAEAEAEITRRLAQDYLVNPRVIVKLTSTQSSQIVLMGEVKKPGVYPLPFGEQVTLLQAIAGAGGFTELASPDRVSLVRRLPDGGQTTLKIRVSDLLGGKGKQPDVPLEPNDVIMVPQVFF